MCVSFYKKPKKIYGFIGLCQSDSNYHEIPNEIYFFICSSSFFFLECVLEKCCLCHHFLLQCVLLVYGLAISLPLALCNFISRKLRNVLNDLNQMESSNYCECMNTGRPGVW